MPRFYIDSSDQEHFVLDEEGLEFDRVEMALGAAVCALSDMVRDASSSTEEKLFTTTVRDSNGREVVRATMTLNVRWSD